MKSGKPDLFTIINTICMLLLISTMIYPFIYMLSISLSSHEFVVKNEVFFWPKGFTMEWYARVFADDRIFIGYRNTIIYVIIGTISSLIVTSLGAFALSKSHMIGRGPLTFCIVFSILFSGGMIPTYLVVKSLGLINTMGAMVLPNLVSSFNVLVFRAFFEGLPAELEDSGKIDGVNDFGYFLRIVAPLSKAVFAAIGLFTAVAIWNDFYTPFLYIKDQSLYPLQVFLRDLVIAGQLDMEATAAQRTNNTDTVIQSLKYATIIVGTLPILILYPFLQKHFVKGVLIGSVKG